MTESRVKWLHKQTNKKTSENDIVDNIQSQKGELLFKIISNDKKMCFFESKI